MKQTPSTEELLRACVCDRDALEALYNAEKARVFAFALSLLSDYALAEDALQETFIRLPRAARRFSTDSGGRAFLLEICRRTCRELRRGARRTGQDEVPEDVASPESPLEDVLTVQGLIGALNDRLRPVVVLHLYHELTFVEIAALLKLPASTVKSHWKRALAILRQELRGTYEDLSN